MRDETGDVLRKLMPIMNNYRLTFLLSLLRSAILFGIILTSVGCNNQKE